MSAYSQDETIARLRAIGYAVAPGLVPVERCRTLAAIAQAQLAAANAPLEYEADLRYPGAPASREAAGGHTVRRLLDAYARDAAFRAIAEAPEIRAWLRAYFCETPVMSRAHHNCVMTKHPAYGSLTGWHRDIRYWAFERDDLVSAWLALGPETAKNGGLWLIPGTHRLALAAERFDANKFFRDDLPQNQELIHGALATELQAGDVLFFHCNTLHSAGPNRSDQVKFSLVYTYHGASNHPLRGTRSAAKPEVSLLDA